MHTDLPAWATQDVEIIEPDPAWPVLANELRRQVEQRLAVHLDGDVEHIGSTAVPGLPAKPVVDLMAPVRRLADSEAADAPLSKAGWFLVPPELDRRPWRRFYILPEGSNRRAHLHLVERQHARWTQALAFRDALRAQPRLASAYAQLKRSLAEGHRTDREAYSAAKAAFVQQVLRECP